MLQSIRERATGWIAGVIFTLLIISMGLLGIRTYLNISDISHSAADVNGISISRSDLSTAMQRIQHQLQADLKTIPADLTAAFRLTVLQSLINDELLKQAAVAEGYRVSTVQSEEAIKTMPQFQMNGHFSTEQFQQLMNASNFSPAGFLEFVGTSLVVNQPKQGIFSTSFVLQDEVKQAVTLFGQKRYFSWLIVDTASLIKGLGWHPNTTEEEIKKYYQDHPAEFQAPEQVSLDYILLSEDKLSPSQSFSKLREKLTNLSYEHPEELTETAKELGLNIQSTPLFTREKGGNDPVSSSESVRSLAFSADILNSGNNSDVIELNPSTVTVVHLRQHQMTKLMPFENVRPSIIKKLQTLATNEKLKTVTIQIIDSLKAGISPDQMSAKFHGLSWQKAVWASRKDSKPARSILNIAFSLTPPVKNTAETFGMGQIDEGYVIVALKEVRDTQTESDSKIYQEIFNHLESSMADVEYEMYQKNLAHHAKIKIRLDENNNQ